MVALFVVMAGSLVYTVGACLISLYFEKHSIGPGDKHYIPIITALTWPVGFPIYYFALRPELENEVPKINEVPKLDNVSHTPYGWME